jgi:hypothetical protein
VFLDRIFDELLTVFGAHILVIGGKYDALFAFCRFRYPFHVHRCRDIAAAPTNKNAYSLHMNL